MGNCPHAAISCADDPSLCADYKVDIGGHWEMRRTEMGVKYGINEAAGDGNIANEYAYSPYCHGDDNDPDASNEWQGAWIHTSPIEGDLGTYIFEMSRSLKTASSVTDAQLEVGEAIDFGFAYWVSILMHVLYPSHILFLLTPFVLELFPHFSILMS